MIAKNDSLHVLRLPREPFLAHSSVLVKHLLSHVSPMRQQILELGCGFQSPLLPILRAGYENPYIHQIDAQPEVVAEASKWNPDGRVEQMLLTDMRTIPDQSKDLVIAMSVFDQNPEGNAKAVASEIHRVLKDDGFVVYIHNEELNLPATADSFVRRANQSRLLIPSNHWSPSNDLDYCSGARVEIEAALTTGRSELAPLFWFLRGIYPDRYGERSSHDAMGKVAVPFLRDCSADAMIQIRKSVEFLQTVMRVEVVHHSTSSLLKDLLEKKLFSAENGFRILSSDVFELRQTALWQNHFEERPPATYFVRGLTRFGFTSNSPPQTMLHYQQSLNQNPTLNENETMFIAYQYGFVASKA
jgi:SAM-dependent methyltransferase